jgi:hypothetical protein
MTTKHLLKLSLLLGYAMMALACNKLLDNELHDNTYANRYWKNEAEIESANAGAYALFRSAYVYDSRFVYWGDLPCGALNNSAWNTAAISSSGDFTVSYRDDLSDWKPFYRVVNQCNLLIDRIPQVPAQQFTSADPEKARNRYLGQAYFMRALAYFNMTRIWGDLPLETTPIYQPEDIVVKGRSADTAVMRLIINDARQAASLMQWEENDKAFATQGAALALLAHAYAWKRDYMNAKIYTDSLIQKAESTGLYALESIGSASEPRDIRTAIFNPAGGSKEVILRLNNSYASGEGTAMSHLASATLKTPYIQGVESNPAILPVRINQYYTDRNDKRLSDAVGFFGLMTATDPILIKYKDVGYKNAATFTDPYAESNFIIFRLADIYLLHAEALYHTGDEAGAMQYVNKIRTRWGAADIEPTLTGTLLKQEILNERFRELIGEGHNYYDQIRNRLYPAWYSGDRAMPENKGWLWPIANSAFVNNPYMDQNPWWRAH